MCGIAGHLGIPYREDIAAEVLNRLGHRGPDGSGQYSDANRGLGLFHTRLAIQDPTPAGAQPLRDPETGSVIVFNGEIYNFKKLRAELTSRGHVFRTGTDTEVLLVLYRTLGEDMLSCLNGIYAFAIWDPCSNMLFVARDGMGVKPFYYCDTSKGFLFASEIKALLCYPEVERTLNATALVSHLTYLWSPAPDTMLRSVRKLEPGMAMHVRGGSIIRSWRHYDLPIRNTQEQWVPSQAARRIRECVRSAVGDQMVSDVPVGAFLSGGLDSSAVAAFAREASPETKLQCFSIDVSDTSARREGMIPDLPYAKRVARHLEVDLHVVRVGPEMAHDLPTMLWHLDEPQADPAPLNVLYISRLARDHGIKVLLSGAGGDDIFTGYRRHHALMLERYWSWLPKSSRRLLSGWACGLPNRSALLRRVRKALQYADLGDDERLIGYFNWIPSNAACQLLTDDMRAAVGNSELRRSLYHLGARGTRLDRMLFLECKHFLADHNLNYTDKMSMAAGVETRVPLLAPELVSLAFTLPDHFKQRGATGKWIFKRAMEGILPNDVIYRPKTGFGAPLRAWLHGPLMPLLEETLSSTAMRSRGIFQLSEVRRLMRLDRTGQVDASYSLFAILCMELWCRMFLDERPAF